MTPISSKKRFSPTLSGHFSLTNQCKFNNLQNEIFTFCFGSELFSPSPGIIKAWFLKCLSFQTRDKAIAIHIIFIFQSLFLTGQENDSTKQEVKIEAESQSSYMETEGTDTEICCIRAWGGAVMISAHTGVCEWGACVLLGGDYGEWL